MAKGKEIPFNLPSVDELFTSQAERDDAKREKVLEVPLNQIDAFPDHPFQVREDEDMVHMVESIEKFGVLTPATVRAKEDGRYELISGHRRKHAAELAGFATLPVIVRNLTRDEAVIAMVDSNMQREHILPSEKAFSYKMKLEAVSRQGKRTDLTSSPMGTKLQGKRSLQVIGEEAGDSRNTVHRYIRLTELIPEILELVDAGAIGLRPAVELSYLPKPEQATLFDAIECEACTPSHAQAIKMRRFSEDGKLSSDVIASIMCEEKPNQAEQFKMPKDKISKFFKPGTSKENMEARIIKGLELLERQERNRGMER